MSDREFRAIQRLVAADPNDVPRLWQYIRLLERYQHGRDYIPSPSPEMPEDPIHRHLSLAMAENGVITSLSELGNITSIPQLEILIAHLFPYGSIGDFASCEWYDNHDETGQDFLMVASGVWSYGGIPPTLEAFVEGHGFLQKLDKYAEIIWHLPFLGEYQCDTCKKGNPCRENGSAIHWREQKLHYWTEETLPEILKQING